MYNISNLPFYVNVAHGFAQNVCIIQYNIHRVVHYYPQHISVDELIKKEISIVFTMKSRSNKFDAMKLMPRI